mmetsp:Transcript_24416/g.59244  ORF Transcript_24416/g.59244 Transcript_24416/m.59244 type:complete len:211 (-) Transcript_24416:126-758(-)
MRPRRRPPARPLLRPLVGVRGGRGGQPLADAKVGEEGLLALVVEVQHVLRLQVPVYHPLAVHVLQGLEHVLRNVRRRPLRQRPPVDDALQEVAPRRVLHDEAADALALRNDVLVKLADALMVQPLEHLSLLQSPLVTLHDLDRDCLPRAAAHSLVHLPERPASAAAHALVILVQHLRPRHHRDRRLLVHSMRDPRHPRTLGELDVHPVRR